MESRTQKILAYFDRINAIPRCSGNEAGVCRWLQAWAAEHGFSSQTDAAGNLVVRVPASVGFEKAPAVVLQGHMDMVCEKTPACSHDFSKDPIRSRREGDWLVADQTTLGADNGIAIAYVLALAEAQDVTHPAMELLFTVDEESGLNGVKKLSREMIRGKRLINLDSEDEGIFTIGCAGGRDAYLTLDLESEPLPKGWAICKLTVGGLKGGHSGIDIDKQRGNANKILAHLLASLPETAAIRLLTLNGGTRHNAIPRDAQALIAWPKTEADSLEQAIAAMTRTLQKQYAAAEPTLGVRLEGVEPTQADCLSPAHTRRAIDLLLALPNGVAGMSTRLPGLVETSNNLATVTLGKGKLTILTSQRSAIASRLDALMTTIQAVAALAGARLRTNNSYPAWQPDMEARLLKQAIAVYQRLFAREPVIQVIHAGLECAIIGDLYPGMEMISFGPTIRNPHSPDERLHIPSVEKVWEFLTALLAEFTVAPH